MKLIITEEQFKQLIEAKDYVYGNYNGNTVEADNQDWDAIPFVYFNNKVYIGYNPELGDNYKDGGYLDENGENDYPNFHSDIPGFYQFMYGKDVELPKRRNTYEYLGRLWYDKQIISFWKYPEDINILKKILNLLSNEINNVYGFNVDFKNYIVDIGEDKNDDGVDILVSVKDYIKGKNATEDEMEMIHLLPSDEKRNTPQMQGALVDKYKHIGDKLGNTTQAEYNHYKKYGMGDSYIPNKKLIENVVKNVIGKINNKDLLTEDPDSVFMGIGKKDLMFTDYDAIAFGIDKTQMCVSYNHSLWQSTDNDAQPFSTISQGLSTHLYISDFYDFLIDNKLSNNKYLYSRSVDDFIFPGRLWTISKIVSFWITPPPNKMMKVLVMLRQELKQVYNYNIDINQLKIEIDSKLIPIQDYINQNNTPENIEPKIHLLPSDEKKNTPQMQAVRDADAERLSNKFNGDISQAEWNNARKKYQGESKNNNKNLISETYISDSDTFWAWVSPENQLIKVPKLKHQGFIMNKYKDAGPWSWDYDRVFDKALLDGWVRVIYEYNPSNYKGELSVNGHYKDRVVNVVKTVFKDLLKYGYKSVYIDIEEPKQSLSFSTYDSAGKFKLMNFLNENKIINENKYTLYHSTNDDFNKFNVKKTAMGVIWFTDSLEAIKNKTTGANGFKKIVQAEVTINNPAGWDEYERYGYGQLENMGYDGVILPMGDNEINYIVFNNNQIKKVKKLNTIQESIEILPLEELKEKYPEIKFTLDKENTGMFKGKYFARADIETQDGKMEYLGALRGPVSLEHGLEFLNNVANKNYDKYY